jgi:hypothetical protein
MVERGSAGQSDYAGRKLVTLLKRTSGRYTSCSNRIFGTQYSPSRRFGCPENGRSEILYRMVAPHLRPSRQGLPLGKNSTIGTEKLGRFSICKLS